MNFQFDFRLEDATPEQADALLETIALWADHRNCWIAGGFHRTCPADRRRVEAPGEEVPDGDHAPACKNG
jgi:hypothetical protein